jgi:ABC-type amino acid transport substrate-binding protein
MALAAINASSPPPREEGNRQAVWDGLVNGTFQVLSSDHAQFIDTVWSGLIPWLYSKKFDLVMSILSYTSEREKHVDFSLPYVEASQALLIRAADLKSVTSPTGTNGKDDNIPMLDTLMQRAKTNAVDTVMIAGEVAYNDGRFTRVDRDAILREIEQMLAKPRASQDQAKRELGPAVFPYVKAFYSEYFAQTPSDLKTDAPDVLTIMSPVSVAISPSIGVSVETG